MKHVSMAEREQLRGLLTAKLRISEQNTKGKHVFLCVFERKIAKPHSDLQVRESSREAKSYLTQAAESVRMTLRDHIILADEQYYSFKDNKKL